MKKRCVPLTCTLIRTFSSGLRPLTSFASPKYGLPCSWMSAGSNSASPAIAGPTSIRTAEKPAIRTPCSIIFDIGLAPPNSMGKFRSTQEEATQEIQESEHDGERHHPADPGWRLPAARQRKSEQTDRRCR